MCLEHYYLDILKQEEIIRKAEKRLGVRKHAALKQHKSYRKPRIIKNKSSVSIGLYVHRQNQKTHCLTSYRYI